MNRDYSNGIHDDVKFFTGIEVEKTPAYELKTLFIVGPQDRRDIEPRTTGIEHLYFGANQSFNPTSFEDFQKNWEYTIEYFLNQRKWYVTLDFDLKYIDIIQDSKITENNLFIPQISIKIPYIQTFNYNTTIKIDDSDFNKSNPGVWCHRLHDLLDTEHFTGWLKYTKDIPND